MTAPRLCIDCDQIATMGTRCPTHHRVEQARDSATYNHQHRNLRASWAPIVATGNLICRRCDQPITRSQAWDLGHGTNGQPSQPEHRDCNRGKR